ncbi:alpha/beta hydrolase [Polynucleobacter sp. IMCC30063]|uniref:alpha/beta hydrolase n=1 Tax=unclassified Polynucleobacter TaxID=2640945 RepID=UPI001F287109|nr:MULTISPECIES: alpha/beta hydrolase [unclassified Polynucleobacter]MCE7505413.1 alpha/beta hydrolase [Polynucleobacter sp. IMCC30063]MCE7527998.1 alpha/beta hydrolase [Polynucleobacter sp. IMCC 30228]
MSDLLPCIEIETAPNPQAAVIWLHGLGADGNDFASVVPQLDLTGCLPIRFVFPSAPSMPVTINGGYVMPAWYDIAAPDLTHQQDIKGIQKSASAIAALIEREIQKGIPSNKIVLAGFSQGCAMALYIGLSFPQPLAGIIALSGYLPLAEQFLSFRNKANFNTPIFMAHGVWDPVVIPKRGEDSHALLKQHSYQVNWQTYPMEHSVHPTELADISLFLQEVLSLA